MSDTTDDTAAEAPLQRTALYDQHVGLGAKMVGFSGWEMPLQYSGIIDEHRTVRERAGLFDLSHMGELWISGNQAAEALAYALVTDPGRLAVGRAHYSMICAEDGGIIDDLIVYRVGEMRFLVVPNAGNAPTVSAAMAERIGAFDAAMDDVSLMTSLVAVQGPKAREILAPVTDVDLESLRYYAIAEGNVADLPVFVARTGYTGEDGFELFLSWDDGPAVWDALMAAGAEHGLQPAGLGARDTLRLEAGMALYGNELDRDTTPMEAALDRLVRFDKAGDFVGRAALEQARDAGPRKRLVGLELRDRGIARHGYPVHEQGQDAACGVVTSGTLSPTLDKAIAMAYVPPEDSAIGTMVDVSIRASRVPAEVVPMPFYKRGES